jgi:hypothetical protein
VGLTDKLPLGDGDGTTQFRVVGKPFYGEHNEVSHRRINSGYFATLNARLLRGRYFAESDDASRSRVVIINQALAKQYFPGEDPVGMEIIYNSDSPQPRMRIIGVVDDVKEGPLDVPARAAMLRPAQSAAGKPFFHRGPHISSGTIRASYCHQRRSSTRPWPCDFCGEDHVGSDSRFTGRIHAQVVGLARRNVRSCRIGVGRSGPLWRDFVFRKSKDSRDWCAHGAWRTKPFGSSAHSERSRIVDRDWHQRRTELRRDFSDADARPALWSRFVGFTNACRGCRNPGTLRVLRSVRARAPGRFLGSHGSLARRVAIHACNLQRKLNQQSCGGS